MIEFGLLGERLSHSYSPKIHSMLGEYKYELIELAKEDIGAFLSSGSFLGLNVTIPYKIEAVRYCDETSDEVERIGCANTLVRRNGKTFGYNTDYFGFDYMIQKSGVDIEGSKCLILGNGGAARTVKTVLSDRKSKSIIVISRRGEDNYENISRHYDADVIVNTTPLGMYPKTGVSPVELEKFKGLRGVFDLIYNPSKTKFILDAIKLGVPCLSGLSMLVAQAKKSFDLFFDGWVSDSIIDDIVEKMSFETQNIVLIGMPGCGKSTVGRALAKKLGRNFIDADAEIEKAAGKSIPLIFEEDGEAEFRKLESEVLKNIGSLSSQIIATGGGCVKISENYDALKQNGKIVWITRDLAKLETKGRPLSVGADMSVMYDERKGLYQKFADFRIENEKTAQDAADEIIETLKSEESFF